MKKLLKEYFHTSVYSKISEKAILLRFATTIAVILFCLISMGTTAFAYFSHDITSSINTIKSANFEANVSVQITNANGENITVNTDNRIAPYADIKAGTPYFVTLKHSERSTAKTGFVIITADRCESRYHTQQLGRDGNGNTETFTFTITANNDTRVTFLAHWGTSSYYSGYNNTDNPLYITKDNREIKLSVTPPLMLLKPSQTTPATTEKLPLHTEKPKLETSVSTPVETKSPAEITVPETIDKPTPSVTEPITSETTLAETIITIPETTIYEPPISETTAPVTIVPETLIPETTAPVTTVPETLIPETTAPVTTVPEIPTEIQPETTPPDIPETSGNPTNEAN